MSRLVLLLALFQLFLTPLRSQHPSRVDSLIRRLGQVERPLDRIPLLNGLSERLLKSDLSSAVRHANESLRLSELIDEDSLISRSLLALSKARYLHGLLDESVESYARLYSLSLSMKDTVGMINALAGLASVHVGLKEHLRAQQALDIARGMAEAVSSGGRMAVSTATWLELHSLYGVAFRGLDNAADALWHVNHGLGLAKDSGFMGREVVRLMLTGGQILQESGRSDTAHSIFMKALTLSREMGDLPCEAGSLWCLGRLSEQQADIETARRFYGNASRLSETSGYLRMSERSARNLAKVYQTLGMADSSVHLASIADERKAALVERKAANALARHSLGMTLDDPVRENGRKAEPSRWMLIGLVAAAFSLSGYLGYRLLAVGSLRNGTGLQPLSENDPAEASIEDRFESGSDTMKEPKPETLAFDRIALSQRIQGIVRNLRLCMHGVDDKRQAELRKLIREMETNRDAESWQEFELRFNGATDGFLERLRSQVPNLTQNERRLCLFLRMDMNTKDISRVTGQSVRAVELGRIRLRKKLNLTHTEEGLNDYLSAM